MQIWTIRKLFLAFQCKFEVFEMAWKHSNANSNHSIGIQSIRKEIRTIRKEFKAFESIFETFENNSKHSKVNQSYLIQIVTVRKGFEAFKCKS